MSLRITLFRIFTLALFIKRYDFGATASISIYIHKMGLHFTLSSID